MRFEWDERKNRTNLKKHGISFELAQEIFDDPFCLTVEDQVTEGEQRFFSIGRLENLVVVIVVHTFRVSDDEETIRLISARKATARERKLYEEPEP